MNRSRILLVGAMPELCRRLQDANHEVESYENTKTAGARLECEWFRLAIVQLQTDVEGVDPERLALATRATDQTPKIILVRPGLDEIGVVLRDALSALDHPASAVAVLSETEGIASIMSTVEKALKNNVGTFGLPVIQNSVVLYSLAQWIRPTTEPNLWVGELTDLLGQLFQRHERIKLSNEITGRKGELASFLVYPESEAIPREHPLIVKCGPRDVVDRILKRYEDFYFRMTPVRLSSTAKTCHFAAIAFPSPSDRPDIGMSLPEFYREKGVLRICDAIDELFTRAWNQWSVQDKSPAACTMRTFGEFYLARLGLEEALLKKSMASLVEQAPSYGMTIKLSGESVEFPFSSGKKARTVCPFPLLYLHGAKQKLLDRRPNQLLVTHGDFRGANLWVRDNPQISIWLDGYESTDWGPGATDVAQLEVILKFHCLETDSLYESYKLEKALLGQKSLDEPLLDPAKPRDSLGGSEKVIAVIEHLRKKWGKPLSSADIKEYYASLFFFTMRELVTGDVIDSAQSPTKRQLHAFLSAAIICSRLEQTDLKVKA